MTGRNSRERGAYLAIASLVILVLFVVLSVGYECARLMEVSNSLQSAADAAAAAGARALGQNRTKAQSETEAQHAFAANLEANGLPTVLATVTGNDTGTPKTMEVEATYPVNLTLMRAGSSFFGIPNTRDVHVRSKTEVPVVAVHLVMDLSSSMTQPSFSSVPTPVANPTRFNALKAALPSLVTGLNAPYNSTGLVTFGSLVTEQVPLDLNSATHLTAMSSAISSLALDPTNTNTNLAEGFRTARLALKNYAGVTRKESLVLTDGAPVGAIVPFDASSVNLLPARAHDAESGSDHLYRLLQDKTPKSYYVPSTSTWNWRNTGSFVVLNTATNKGYVYSATRLVDPVTNLAPTACGATVPTPPNVSGGPDGSMFVPGVVAVRKCGECGTFAASVVHWTGEVTACGCDENNYFYADSPVGAGWKRFYRAEYSSNCLKDTGRIKIKVTPTLSIDGTEMNRAIPSPAPVPLPEVLGPSPADMIEVAGNAFLVQAYLAQLDGIRVHGILAGQSDHAMAGSNAEYQGYDANRPRYLMMARVTRQKYVRDDAPPFAISLPVTLLPDFAQLNPLPGPSSFADDQQNLLFRSADANFALWFQQVSSIRRMKFVL